MPSFIPPPMDSNSEKKDPEEEVRKAGLGAFIVIFYFLFKTWRW